MKEEIIFNDTPGFWVVPEKLGHMNKEPDKGFKGFLKYLGYVVNSHGEIRYEKEILGYFDKGFTLLVYQSEKFKQVELVAGLRRILDANNVFYEEQPKREETVKFLREHANKRVENLIEIVQRET